MLNCSECNGTIEAYSDTVGSFQCEVCTTYQCVCGLNDFVHKLSLNCAQIVCSCGAVIESTFIPDILGVSDEALTARYIGRSLLKAFI